MLRRILGVTGIGLWLALIAVLLGLQAKANGAERMFKNLPEGWKVEKSFTASREQTAAIGQKLGGRISKLTNTILSFKEQRLQVNVIHCSTAEQAEKIYKGVLEVHNGIADYALIDGNLVFEFAKCYDIQLARQARRALGLELARLDSVARKIIKKIPPGWEVVDSFIAPQEQTATIGKKLGGRIKKLSNTIFLVQAKRFQVNVFDCATPQEAEKICKNILKMKADPAFCLKFSNLIVEFVGGNVELAKKAVYALAIVPPPIETQAKDLVKLLASGNYEKAVGNFDSTMKNALPPDKLKQVWDSLIVQAGAFVEQTGVRKEKILQYDVVFVSCKFEKSILDAKVVFNQKKQISGLFFVPPQSSAEK
jgi:hypothetical protein